MEDDDGLLNANATDRAEEGGIEEAENDYSDSEDSEGEPQVSSLAIDKIKSNDRHLIQHLASGSKSNLKNKILYTLWFIGHEWIDTQNDGTKSLYGDDDEATQQLVQLTLQRKLINAILKTSRVVVKLPISIPMTVYRNLSRQSTKQNTFSLLQNHNKQQATSRIALSHDGSILAATENTSITFRSSNDNFNNVQKKWNYHSNDKESQWQRMCFNADNSLMAFSTSGCTIYIINIATEETIHILSPKMISINPNDGIVDLILKNSKCGQSSASKCFELLILGYDMVLRRFHIPVDQSFTIHAFEMMPSPQPEEAGAGSADRNAGFKRRGARSMSTNSLSSMDKECYSDLPSCPDLKELHQSVGSMDYSHENGILAIGGNKRYKSNNNTKLKSFVSFWRVLDSAPYYQLLNEESEATEHDEDDNQSRLSRLWTMAFGRYFSSSVVHKVRFSNDGNQLLSLDLSGTVRLWNTRGEQPLTTKIWKPKTLASVWKKNVNSPFMSASMDDDDYNQGSSSANTSQVNLLASEQQSSPASVEVMDPAKSIVTDIGWWNQNEIILINRSGQFLIFSMTKNENCLLHDPEVVSTTQPAIVTNAHNGRFFILETSHLGDPPIDMDKQSMIANTKDYISTKINKPLIKRYKSILRYFNGGEFTDGNEEDPFHFQISRHPEEQYDSLTKKIKSYFVRSSADQQVVPIAPQVPFQIIKRIIKFQSTTPEQLFKTKVSQKEYGNALLIAEHYGLDKDLVHQKRFIRTHVTGDSIHQFLSKIQDLNWILWTCHIRIPTTLESTKDLLHYALQRTDQFNESTPIEVLRENKLILLHRLVIVNYLNRLKTYQEIYGNDFDSSEFLRFRDCSLVSAAMEYASFEHFKAVEILFSYYHKLLLSFRLDILSLVPEPISPDNYKSLLPDEFNIWSSKKSFTPDWLQSNNSLLEKVLEIDVSRKFDSIYLKSIISSIEDYEDIRSGNHIMNRNRDSDIYSIDYQIPSNNDNNMRPVHSTKSIREWYIQRSIEIDRKSGQIDQSLRLLEIAISDKHISNLESIKLEFEELNIIVYQLPVTPQTMEISYDKYHALDKIDRLLLLLSDSTADSVYYNTKSRCGSQFTLTSETIFEYFKKLDNLRVLRGFIKSFLAEKSQDELDESLNGLLRLSNETILSSKQAISSMQSLDLIEDILQSLPNPVEYHKMTETQKQIDLKLQLIQFIKVDRVLFQYGLSKPISFFSYNNEEQFQTIHSLICKAIKIHQHSSHWKSGIENLLSIKKLAYPSVVTKNIYYQFVKELILEGHINLAKEYLVNCGARENIESLLLTCSRDYFNSSATYGRTVSLDQAKQCLELLKPPTRKMVKELNLLDVLYILYDNYNFQKLPLQIRLILDQSTDGKYEIIHLLLESNNNAYLDTEKILSIINLLSDWDQESKLDQQQQKVFDKINIQIILGNYSLSEKSNLHYTSRVCKSLISDYQSNRNHILANPDHFDPLKDSICQLCFDLSSNTDFTNIPESLNLLSFAIQYSKPDNLTLLLETYKRLDAQKQSPAIESEALVLSPPFIEKPISFLNILDHDYSTKRNKDLLSLSDQFHQIVETSNQPANSILEELAKLSLRDGDMRLFISYLLNIQSHDTLDNQFQHLIEISKSYQSSLERITRLACYYYSIRVLLASGKSSNEIFTKPIDDIIAFVEKNQSAYSEISSLVSFIKYYNIMIDSVQLKELSEFNQSIDFARFKVDADYKSSTILSFALSNQPKSLQTSITMAKRYGIDYYSVLIRHIEWQLLENEGPSTYIFERDDINELAIRLEETLTTLSALYERVDGKSFQQLFYYYELLLHLLEYSKTRVSEQSIIKYKKKLLTLIITSLSNSRLSTMIMGNQFNFKELIEPDYDPMEKIKTLLFEDKILFFSSLINLLLHIRSDDLIHNTSTLSKMYLNLIWNLIANTNQNNNNSDDIYIIVSKFKKQLDQDDLLLLYNSLLLNDKGLSLTVDSRLSFSQDIIQMLKDNNSELMENQNLISYYELIENHLLLLKKLEVESAKKDYITKEFILDYDSEISKVLNNTHLTLQEFINSKDSLISNLFVKLITETKVTPSILYKLHTLFYPISISTPSKKITSLPKVNPIYQKLYSLYIKSILILIEKQSYHQLSDQLAISTNDHSIDDWDSTLSSILSTEIREQLESHSIGIKIKLLELMVGQNPKIYIGQEEQLQKDSHKLKQLKSQDIIREIWKDLDISDKDLEIQSCQDSIPLFNKLLENSSNITNHLSYLSKLLLIWNSLQVNQDEISELNECWFNLYSKMIQLISSQKETSILISTRMDQSLQFTMTHQQERDLLDLFSPEQYTAKYKFALLSHDTEIIEQTIIPSIIGDASRMDSIISDQQLLQILYSNGYIHKFINTRLYQPLVNILLLSNNNSNLEFSQNIYTSLEYNISILTSNNYYYQASILALSKFGVHHSTSQIYNLDNSIQYLDKYLKSALLKISNLLQRNTSVDDLQTSKWNKVSQNLVTSIERLKSYNIIEEEDDTHEDFNTEEEEDEDDHDNDNEKQEI